MVKNNNDYSVVIVEYYSSDHILNCLNSITDQSQKPKEIIVVVNGCDKKVLEKIEETFPKVHIINPHQNLGYSKACNLGIANTSANYVLVSNPDVVYEIDSCERALEFFSVHDDVASVGPKILEIDGNIYPSARNEPKLIDAIGHAVFGMFSKNNKYTRKYRNSEIDAELTREVDWLSGAAVFLRRSALDEVGGWDEDYFMYCEDIDLGRKFRVNRWKNYFVPTSVVTHVGGVSTSRTPIKFIVAHHVSLYKFISKKYDNKLIAKLSAGLLIAFRLPLAIIAHYLRID
ncbi:MAG: glycosyltransferase family 2 protein [Acidimicrobiia bacterium]